MCGHKLQNRVLTGYTDAYIGPGALGDELRQMHMSGAVRLGAWQRSAREIPEPDHALLGPESVVLYYVSRGF